MGTIYDDAGITTPSTATTLVIAAGTTQVTATVISAPNGTDGARIVVTTTPTGSGVILPADLQERRVFNRGANLLSAYPPVGGQWEALGVNQPAGIDVGGSATLHMATKTQGYIA